MSAELNWMPAKAKVHDAPDDKEVYYGLKVDIVFGMPRYQCRFHGICKLEVDESDLSRPVLPQCGKGKGRLFLIYEVYCLICFQKGSLTAATRQDHFEREYFVLQQKLPFAEVLTRRLGRQYYLQAGRYRIQDRPDVYSILFRTEDTAI